MLKIALEGGGNPKAITSRCDGTALIAAAHLGHAEVVRILIAVGAPLRHKLGTPKPAVLRFEAATRERSSATGLHIEISVLESRGQAPP